MKPDTIAEIFWHVHSQHKSAWTHELDVRLFAEKFQCAVIPNQTGLSSQLELAILEVD
jgi:hypothetical protein